MHEPMTSTNERLSDDDSPGSALRRARERAGLSVDAVAARLRMLHTAISDLESDRYERLRGDTYVRGYLRNYARLLEVNAEPLVARFDEQRRAERALQASREQRQQPRRPSAGRIGSLALMLGLGALPVFGKRDIGDSTAYPDHSAATSDGAAHSQESRQQD
jgi:cytoskeleton protein RodZ